MISAVQRYTGHLKLTSMSKVIDKWAKLVGFRFIYEPIAGYLLMLLMLLLLFIIIIIIWGVVVD